MCVANRPELCTPLARNRDVGGGGGGGETGRRERSCIVYLVLGLDVELDLLARQGADSGVP